MAQKFVGIDLGSHQVKIVVATAGLRGVQVLNTFQAAVDPQQDLEDALAASAAVAVGLLREQQLSHLPVGVCLPGALGSYRVLKFPFADQKRVSQALAFEIDGQFPLPVTELEYDHFVTPRVDGGGQALVVAVRRDLLSAVMSSLREAGVDVRLMTTVPMALAQVMGGSIAPRAADDPDDPTKPAMLVVDVGGRSTQLIALGDRGPLAVRTLRRGGRNVTGAIRKAYGLDAQSAEMVKLRDGFIAHSGSGALDDAQQRLSATVGRAMEGVLREIEHTRLWLRSELGHEVTEVRLVGGGANLRGLSEYLHDQLQLPVSMGRPRARFGGRYDPQEGWALDTAALGAAMGAARRPLVQLQDESGIQRDSDWIQQRFGTILALGLAIVAVAAVDTIVKIKALETERDRYRDELSASTQKVFGESKTSAAEIQELLDAVEGGDLTSVVPERTALDVLQLVAQASAPTDLGKAPSAPPPVDPAADPALDPTAPVDPAGNPAIAAPPGGEPAAEPVPAGPVDVNAGIVVADELELASLDIRELKIDMKVSATRAAAQDRLAIKLKELGCISDITKGKVTDRSRGGADRKVFEMTMSHRCYSGMAASTEEE